MRRQCAGCGRYFASSVPSAFCLDCIDDEISLDELRAERERDEDDGRTYADPRDERDERRNG